MTDSSPPQAEGTTVQPAAPAEPALDMDLSDAPMAPPWAGSDSGSDEGRAQGGDRGGDADREPT